MLQQTLHIYNSICLPDASTQLAKKIRQIACSTLFFTLERLARLARPIMILMLDIKYL